VPHGNAIGLGLLLGALARISTLRSDYRQYPTYPHSYVSHLFLGFMAALAGAVTVPALLEQEWTAVTFFLLVSQQFREIRSMERDALKAMEDDELVTRGSDYIEDIAKVFEARYYVVILVSASSTFGFEVGSIWLGMLLGALSFTIGALLMGRQRLGDVVTIETAPVIVRGRDIYVGDIFIMNLGLIESREIIQDHALGAVLVPKDDNARGTIASPGQRQAIIHDAATVLGARKDSDTPEFTPMAKRDLRTGRVGVYIVPMEKDREALLEALRRVPVLETARGTVLKTKAGREARKGR
jgi:hypothetical protein